MSRSTLFAACAFAACALAAGTADAATYCVHNSTELRTALDAIESNGQADEIRLRAGTYYASASQPFKALIAEPYGLRISGGWTGLSESCRATTGNATLTVLDGMHVTSVLRLGLLDPTHVVVPITVEGLTLRNGLSSSGNPADAAGLSIYGFNGTAQSARVDRVIVEHNTGTVYAPAVYLSSSKDFVRFSNSIVRWNDTADAGAIAIHANAGASALLNLTVLSNTNSGGEAAITWSGLSAGKVFGTLLWGNSGGFDLHPYPGIVFFHTRYGTASMTPPFPSSENYQLAAPQLDAMHRPAPTSPLRDTLGAYQGFGTLDVYGRDRALGGYSDIGAAEGI